MDRSKFAHSLINSGHFDDKCSNIKVETVPKVINIIVPVTYFVIIATRYLIMYNQPKS